MLLLAHIDVVEARREDWNTIRSSCSRPDGYFHGRGAIDDKAMAAIFVANLIEYRREGFKPERDIILALTTDEELADSPHNGVRWLLEHQRALIDAEFALNEGGGGALRNGRPFRLGMQLAEKVYQTFLLEVTDPGGHSASAAPRQRHLPAGGGADAARAVRFSATAQPGHAREFRAARRSRERRPIAAAMQGAAGRHDRSRRARAADRPTRPTTRRCAPPASPRCWRPATRENALPQTARATVNCRILPDEPVEEIAGILARASATTR